MSFKDFLASKSKAPSQPLWLTSVEGAAPRVEPPPAPPPPPPPPYGIGARAGGRSTNNNNCCCWL